ncbi:toxic anion resistance protein [Curtobacterium sp. MCBD17_040]|uniref:toxic anion resistance protein n=1 Tax=Curtobacterium sp. MCBD17_040 TaxID=2175674 RepID=UPI000DA7ACB9|nr:toxic anion resistance protein [Curtobacterium sp. MCBD17_040]WIB65399.1 toxic anion resistance protein [Curtobacterium sp. MCBD17_040]
MPSLTPPKPANEQPALILDTPEPVEEVEPSAAQAMLDPISPSRELEIGSTAKQFLGDVTTFNPNSPRFGEMLADVRNLAAKEIVASSAGANRLLDRSAASIKSKGGDSSSKVIATLSDLRSTVQDLTPNAADLSTGAKILGFLPGGNRIRKYFQKYETAQEKLDGIVASLTAGATELQRDNAELENEKRKLWDAMGSLNEYIVLAQKMDGELVTSIDTLRSSGNIDAANTLETKMLFEVRQRQQDLLTQLAVAVQGYMAMDLTQKNNIELVKGVERAKTTTLFALRTAIITAQALDSQVKVLEALDKTKEVTENVILSTSAMLRDNTLRVQQKAVEPAVAIDTLTRAFDDIYATLDAIDTFRQQANTVMQGNITALTTQLERAKPKLEEARALDA